MYSHGFTNLTDVLDTNTVRFGLTFESSATGRARGS